MELERVIAALAPRTVVARAPIEVRDLAYAAGTVESGALFFCVPGARADGHDFAADAVRERDWLVTLKRRDGSLVYMVFIAPDRDFGSLRPSFEQMLRSLRLR